MNERAVLHCILKADFLVVILLNYLFFSLSISYPPSHHNMQRKTQVGDET